MKGLCFWLETTWMLTQWASTALVIWPTWQPWILDTTTWLDIWPGIMVTSISFVLFITSHCRATVDSVCPAGVKTLDMSFNGLQGITSYTFSSLAPLTTLNLQGNRLEQIEDWAFSGNIQCQQLKVWQSWLKVFFRLCNLLFWRNLEHN